MSASATAVLSLVPGVDVRGLPIGPEEAFVLSRIGSATSQADLAAMTGLDPDQLAAIVEKLQELGAVALRAVQPAPESVRIPRPPALPGETGLNLDAEQRRLLALHPRLARVNHYELLGVPPDADARTIKRAYEELVKRVHPDRFFRQDIGELKGKFDQLLARLTEAYDTLACRETRDAYDRTVLPTLDARPTTAPDRPTTEAPRSTAPNGAPPGSAHRSAVHAIDVEARRRALARKLLGSSAPPPRSTTPPAHEAQPSTTPAPSRDLPGSAPESHGPPAPTSAQALAAAELKQRYAAGIGDARRRQRDHYEVLAAEALRVGDLVAAVNALRIASTLTPDDASLRERLASLERRAASELSDTYAERAHAAARDGHLAEAARLYERAAVGKPSAKLYERAAACLLDAGGDLRHVQELARRAVSLAPTSARCRMTLARFYIAAKLKESALAELQRASELAPDDPSIRDWIRRLKRGEL